MPQTISEFYLQTHDFVALFNAFALTHELI